MLKIILH